MPCFPLRDYQDYAVSCAVTHLKYKPDENGYIKACGGAGKSVMIAALAENCYDMGKTVVVLARSEKLLTQNRAKFHERYLPHIGIYCSGLGEKMLDKPITIASIQSIWDKRLQPDICLIDEVQNLHPDDGGDTQYWQFLRDAGNPQIIGFTATDFRTGSGKLTFGKMIADIPIQPLIDAGFIITPSTKVVATPDVSGVQIIRGEYNEGQLEEIYLEPELLGKSIEILQSYTATLHSVVIFTQSRKHGKVLQQAMLDNGMEAVYVDGSTPKDELRVILDDFEALKFKYLINVALLVEGWDCPSIDCVAVFLKTLSKGKFEQILFRGTRPAPHLHKKSFLVLDMGGNFMEHGPLGSPYVGRKKGEAVQSQGKICPECEEYTKPLAKECPDCGYIFPEPERPKVTHNYEPDTASYSATPALETFDVHNVTYKKHKSKAGNDTLQISYACSYGKYGNIAEWYSPFHENDWARSKVEALFSSRGHALGSPVNTYSWDDLLFKAEQMKRPTRITVDFKDKFPRIARVDFDEKIDPIDDFIPY